MSTEAMLEFLRRNQPLPPSRQASDELFDQFGRVRQYFTCVLDERAVPLLIGALGEGDGHGLCQMLETTLFAYPEDLVVAALLDGMRSRYPSVRYWSAQFAANYPREEFLRPLADVCKAGGVDERIAAITAIEVVGTKDARQLLRDCFISESDPAVKRFIGQSLQT